MSVYYPDSVGSQGKDTWIWVPTIATKTAMTVAEATATGAVVLQNAMRPGFGSSSETEKINDERQGSLNVYQRAGTTTVTLPDMIVIDRPQDSTGGAMNKHLEALVPGAVGYLINRRGIGSAPENWVAPTAAQKYIGYPVEVASVNPNAPGDTKSFEATVSLSVTGAVFKGTIAA